MQDEGGVFALIVDGDLHHCVVVGNLLAEHLFLFVCRAKIPLES